MEVVSIHVTTPFTSTCHFPFLGTSNRFSQPSSCACSIPFPSALYIHLHFLRTQWPVHNSWDLVPHTKILPPSKPSRFSQSPQAMAVYWTCCRCEKFQVDDGPSCERSSCRHDRCSTCELGSLDYRRQTSSQLVDIRLPFAKYLSLRQASSISSTGSWLEAWMDPESLDSVVGSCTLCSHL
jgi:hypothetical protein